ncbi:MAG TPA: outer membrane beta-barrel protein [Burkholderiaceae bacterium]|nr:outer membrane beta-barrel protein [Burkholderiaceae bacterium]
MKKTLIALAMAAACTAPALANDTGFYGGLDVGSSNVDGLGSEFGFGAFLGYQVNQNFAGELTLRRVGTWKLGGVTVDLDAVQISALGMLPFTPQTKGYLRVGYGDNSANASFAGSRGSASDGNALVGFGIQHSLNRDMALRAEYSRLASDTDQFNVGLVFKF